MTTIRNDQNGEWLLVGVDADGQQQWKPLRLSPPGALATLLAVTETLDVGDAANAVGLTADDLVAEAQAWAMGADIEP